MSDKHPRCPMCKGLLKHEPADILGPERVKCILCGWEKTHGHVTAAPDQAAMIITPAPVVDPIKIEEENCMSTTTKRGYCPSCKRDDVLMPGPKCSRCYDRASRGVDAITGEPIPPLRAHDHIATPKTKLPPKAPSTETAEPSAYKIDLVECLDASWAILRTHMVQKLVAEPTAQSRLSMTFKMVTDLKSLAA
jgi:hypothetical protein